MRKIVVSLVFVALFLCPLAFAGNIDLIGRAGMYTPPGSGGQSYGIFGVAVQQEIAPHLIVEGRVENSSYTAGGNNYSYTPITVDLLYNRMLAPFLDLYAGGGASYNATTINGANSSTTAGAELVAGISSNLMGLIFGGVEARYIIPDLNNTSLGASAVSCYIGGDVTRSIRF